MVGKLSINFLDRPALPPEEKIMDGLAVIQAQPAKPMKAVGQATVFYVFSP